MEMDSEPAYKMHAPFDGILGMLRNFLKEARKEIGQGSHLIVP